LKNSNLDSLSISETDVNPGSRSRKSAYLNELDVRKPLIVPIPHRSEELRLYKPVLERASSKPRLKSGIFKCISWLKCSYFGRCDDLGFLKESRLI
jgi:hypothetical protein